jgi:hypothetical protein
MAGELAARIDDRMVQRICGEFLEMPGLCLTLEQARRLWALDEATCRALLDFLVDARFLCPPTRGLYSRAHDGFAERPHLTMEGGAVDGGWRRW